MKDTIEMNTRLPDHSVTGDGDVTVFMLHGAFGAKEYWRNQIKALSDAGYRVVAWDAPGYGVSPLPADFSVQTAAEACARLIDAQGGDRNVLLGHSMGGMIAQRAFDLRTDRIDGLILSATSAAFGRSEGEWQQAFVRDRVAPLDAGQTIPEHLLSNLSPLSWEHVNLTGDYLWEDKPAIDENGFRAIPFAL